MREGYSASDNSLILRNAYDARGNKVLEEQFGSGGNVQQRTEFVYSQLNLLEEHVTAQGKTESFYYVVGGLSDIKAGLRDPFERARGDMLDQFLVRRHGGQIQEFYLLDGLGSVVGLTTSGGRLGEAYLYDEYGKPTILDGNLAPSQSMPRNRHLFTGRHFEPLLGLYDLRARHYDPSTGSFLQRDPATASSRGSLYSYVDANPMNWTDKIGLWRASAHYNLSHDAARAVGFSQQVAGWIAQESYDVDVGSIGAICEQVGWAAENVTSVPVVSEGALNTHYETHGTTQAEKEAALQKIRDMLKQQDADAVFGLLEQEGLTGPDFKDKLKKVVQGLGRKLHTIQDSHSHGDQNGLPANPTEHDASRDVPATNYPAYAAAYDDSVATLEKFNHMLDSLTDVVNKKKKGWIDYIKTQLQQASWPVPIWTTWANFKKDYTQPPLKAPPEVPTPSPLGPKGPKGRLRNG